MATFAEDTTFLDTLKNKLRLSYEEIDVLVRNFIDSKDESTKKRIQEVLLKAFHSYFMKYVTMCKGHMPDLKNKDTIAFLSLFCKNSGSKPSANALLDAWRNINIICSSLESDDIYNQLVMIFLDLLHKFRFMSCVSFVHYVTLYIRWDFKDWLIKLAKEPLVFDGNSVSLDYESNIQPIEAPSKSAKTKFNIDLGWVYDPQSSIFKALTRYERFLLYLHYKEGLSSENIAKKLMRSKYTINVQLNRILGKLTKLFNPEHEEVENE